MTSLARLAPAAAAAILLTAGIVTLALLTTRDDEPLAVHLQGVSPQALVDVGVTLTAPAAAENASISGDDARSSVLKQYTGARAREAVLVRLADNHQVPPIDRLAWAVNLDPATVSFPALGPLGPRGSVASRTLWAVSFVDAKSGALMFTRAASEALPTPVPTALGQ
jgi:hypothetical protein